MAESQNVGVCLQAYLHRTADDLSSLIGLGGGVRLVKGAYREPAAVAYPRKRDVDDNYLALVERMLSAEARSAGLRAVFGTHDRRMIEGRRSASSTATQACVGVKAVGFRTVRPGSRLHCLFRFHWREVFLCEFTAAERLRQIDPERTKEDRPFSKAPLMHP